MDGLEDEVVVLNEGVADLKTEVVEQGERLGDLEVVVEETVDKVEEIDKKVYNCYILSNDMCISIDLLPIYLKTYNLEN